MTYNIETRILSSALRPAGGLDKADFIAELSELIADERGTFAVVFAGWVYGGNSDQAAQPVDHLVSELIYAFDNTLFRCRHVVTSTPEIRSLATSIEPKIWQASQSIH